MTKAACGTAVVLTICVAIVIADQPLQNDSAQAGRLSSQIGPAAPQRYKSIRDAKDWGNPYLMIRREGIEVIAKGLPFGRQTVTAADLQRTLIALPVTAWPYGKVVAVQDIGIRAAGDEQPIADNSDVEMRQDSLIPNP
jgi:hypothetical protein